VRRGLVEDDLQRRPDVCLEQLASEHVAVGSAQHDGGVHSRLTVFDSNVTEQRQDLHLLPDVDLRLVLAFSVEAAELRVAERPIAVKRAAVRP
jgi:hypothetical protein